MATEPLSAEYAKSGKAGCKGCGKSIGKGELRVGYVGKANFGTTAWYHYDCMWTDSESLKSVDASKSVKDLVQNYDSLKDEDKKKLDKDLPKYCQEASKAEPKKKTDIAAEYAPSAKSNCKGCSKTIDKGALRVGFPGKANFGATAWYHYDCVWKESAFLAPIDTSQSMETIADGFKKLKEGDQKKLTTDLKKNCKLAAEKEPGPVLIMAAEYAKSDKSECKGCSKKITKNTLRVGFTGKANFGAVAWYHLDCLKKCPEEYAKGTDKPLEQLVDGFEKLNNDDQKKVEKEVKSLTTRAGAAKRKSEGGDGAKVSPAKKSRK